MVYIRRFLGDFPFPSRNSVTFPWFRNHQRSSYHKTLPLTLAAKHTAILLVLCLILKGEPFRCINLSFCRISETTTQSSRMESMWALFLAIVLSVIVPGFAQESVNAHEGINIGFHAGVALLMCFGILGTCAISVNILSRKFARYLQR